MAPARKFDHDDARARFAAGETFAALARRYGVNWKAVAIVVSEKHRQQRNDYFREYQRRTQISPCPGGCGGQSWRGALCPACSGKARRVDLPHGTESKYTSEHCHCDACRAAAAKARRDRRHANIEAARAYARAYKRRQRADP